MRLHNEFSVGAPLERTWPAIADFGRVLSCLPAARLQPVGADNLFRGEFSAGHGSAGATYRATVRLDEVDDDGHLVTIDVEAREVGGAGVLSAAVHGTLEPDGNGGTRVLVDTEVKTTGGAARLERDALEGLAGRLLGDFATRLADEVLPGAPSREARPAAEPEPEAQPAAAGAARGGGEPEAGGKPAEAGDVLDLGSLLSGGLARYAPAGAAGALALLLVGTLAGRRRRSRRGLEIRYEW